MNNENNFFKKFRIYLLRFLLKYFKYFDYKFISNKFKEEKVNLINVPELKKGWYLTCFYQNNYQNNIIGVFNLRKSFFEQKRKYKKGKPLYRIIHLNKNSSIEFRLNQKVDLFELNIIRIPSKLAYFITLKNNYRNGAFNISKLNFSKNWYFYNKNFSCQTKRIPLIPYGTYIKLIEKRHTKKFILSDNKFLDSFCIIDYSQFSETKKEWVIPIKKGDKLSNFALAAFIKIIKETKNCNLIYTDEDFIDKDGNRQYPKFKTAWNRELYWSDPDFGRSWVIKGYLWNKALKHLKKANSQIPDILEIIYFISNYLELKNDINTIYHLPLVCYHRKLNSHNIHNRNGNKRSAKKLYEHLIKNKKSYGEVNCVKILSEINCHKIEWSLPKKSRLSIVISTKDKYFLLKKCIDSIFDLTEIKNHQIIIVDNNSEDIDTLKYLNKLNSEPSTFDISVIPFKEKFNFSKINNLACQKSYGDSILLLNNDVEFKSKSWDIELLSNSLRKGIGCVGIKLFYPNNYIQHAGVVLGLSDFAGYSHKDYKKNENGYECRIQISQEYLSLTGACLALSKQNWERLNGLNSKNLQINYNDLDLCLRCYELGLRNIYNPFVEAIHHESSTRGNLKSYYYNQWKKELKWMRNRWDYLLSKGDISYNPNLTLLSEDFLFSIDNKNINAFSHRNTYSNFKLKYD